jgi:hypothetical protein
MDTLHIKVEHTFNLELKRLAKARNSTVSDLIRQALVSCYQIDIIGLPEKQRQALEAYRGGFISLGKLSELMGRTLLEMRDWLNEHNIPQNNSFSPDDVKNAS